MRGRLPDVFILKYPQKAQITHIAGLPTRQLCPCCSCVVPARLLLAKPVVPLPFVFPCARITPCFEPSRYQGCGIEFSHRVIFSKVHACFCPSPLCLPYQSLCCCGCLHCSAFVFGVSVLCQCLQTRPSWLAFTPLALFRPLLKHSFHGESS